MEATLASTITVRNLRKRYGDLTAVDGVDFEVERGQVFCLLGPNGAGKTTTIECVEGHRVPDDGDIRVLGLDPATDGTLRHRIGVQLQEASLPARLTVAEALQLFSVLYERSDVPWHLLEMLGLEEKRDDYFVKLSGGQKQRLFVALALINDPEVVFLDEITTGLDPRARQSIWEMIRGIRASGATVVLCTHFMDEAEALADRVAIMRSGRIVANGTPTNLIASIRGDDEVCLNVEGNLTADALTAVGGVSAAERDGERDGGMWRVRGSGRGWIARLVSAVDGAGCELIDLSTRRPTLEDVYLALTGDEYDENDQSDEPEVP